MFVYIFDHTGKCEYNFVFCHLMEETNGSSSVAAVNGASNTTTTTAWFEFILDETLLERHLSDPNAGERHF